MPRLDGIELIKRIVRDHSDVDVIAITGYEQQYKYTHIIGLGASDFIGNINELEGKINRIIRERSLRAGLRRLSRLDPFTGLYNRGYFEENLRCEVVRAFRQHYGFYLLLMDIDNLKLYNDKYGHRKGDELIKELAEIIIGEHSQKRGLCVSLWGRRVRRSDSSCQQASGTDDSGKASQQIP